MSSSVTSFGSRLQVGSFSERISLLTKYEPTLTGMLGKDQLDRVKELAKNTFDPQLWRTLNFYEPSKYHWIIKEQELLRGCLWIQEDSNSEVAVLWSQDPGWIFRAFPSKDKKDTIVVESYMAHAINISQNKQEMSIENFQSVVDGYLTKHTHPKEVVYQSPFAKQFQQQLEIHPIIFTITRAACAKLAQLRKEYSSSVLDMSIVMGIDGKVGEKFVPEDDECNGVQMMEISKYFINGRLRFLHEEEGEPETTSERVAPVMRTFEAFRQVTNLRKMNHKDILDDERIVPKIVSEEAIEGKSLHDLRTWFVLVPGGIVEEFHEFEILPAEPSPGESSLTLFMDFQDDAWKLRSRLLEST